MEYWASIGRRVGQLLTPEVLLSIRTGLARLCVEPVDGVALDADAVFDALDVDRTAGTLAESVTSSALRYQASSARSGCLEQHHPDGRAVIGQYRDGRFVPTRAKRTSPFQPVVTVRSGRVQQHVSPLPPWAAALFER